MWPRVNLRDDPSPAFAPLGGAGTAFTIQLLVHFSVGVFSFYALIFVTYSEMRGK